MAPGDHVAILPERGKGAEARGVDLLNAKELILHLGPAVGHGRVMGVEISGIGSSSGNCLVELLLIFGVPGVPKRNRKTDLETSERVR